MDKLGVFHANQTSMCLYPHLRVRLALGWCRETGLRIFTDGSKAVPLLWIICVIYVLCVSCFRVCSLLPCGHLLGKGCPLGYCL